MSDSIDNGGPAFPFAGQDGHVYNDQGMSLRDYFAAKANSDDLYPYLEGPICEQIRDAGNGRKQIIHAPLKRSREEAKYAYADAMLKARAQQ